MSYRSWQLKNLPPENPTWGFTEVLICFILYILLRFCFYFVEPIGLKLFSYIITDINKQKVWFYLVSIIISNSFIILLCIFLVKKRYSTIKELGITSINLFRGLTFGIFNGLIIFFTVIGIGLIFGNLLGVHEEAQIFTKNFLLAKSWDMKVIFYIIAIFIIPFTQGVLFQGLMYPVLRSGTGKGVAYFLIAIIYAGSFFDLQRAVPLFFAGFILTYIYEESGNLFAPILANSIWQGLMLWLISVTSWK